MVKLYWSKISDRSRLLADKAALAYANGEYRSVHEKITDEGSVKPLYYNCPSEKHASAINQVSLRSLSKISSIILFMVGFFTEQVVVRSTMKGIPKSRAICYSLKCPRKV